MTEVYASIYCGECGSELDTRPYVKDGECLQLCPHCNTVNYLFKSPSLGEKV